MGYDSRCCRCPYMDQRHLDPSERTSRNDPPVEAEVNGSDVLIVALAPGVEEWVCGHPLMPTRKRGGTAGRRIELSWNKKCRVRSQYDIVEAVQCYPGSGADGHDKTPSGDAVAACRERLRATLEQGSYRKAIALGEVAFESLSAASADVQLQTVKARHPNGGATTMDLNALWD